MVYAPYEEHHNRMDLKQLTGSCDLMCPKAERLLREKEGLLHRFEMKQGTENQKRPKADVNKIIKSYNRSAAGQVVNNPADLRPFPVLIKTIKYLFNEIFPKHEQKPLMVYNFMFDRLRSIRQDMVIQNLNEEQSILILVPIIRFHVYFGYILLEENVGEYDAHINNTHLQECLKRLLDCYDSLKRNGTCFQNHYEMECFYIIFNLGNIIALERGMQLTKVTKCYQDCVNLSISWYLKNYVRVLNTMKNLSVLMMCVFAIHVPDIRKYAFWAMSNAYNSNNSCYPFCHLQNILLYNNYLEIKEDCDYFNLKQNANGINFLKKEFNCTAKLPKPRRLSLIDERLKKCDLINLLLNGS